MSGEVEYDKAVAGMSYRVFGAEAKLAVNHPARSVKEDIKVP